MVSLLRLLIFTRWGRLLIALVLLGAAAATTIAAFAVTNIQMKSGIIVGGSDVVDSQTNAYKYSELTLDGDSATYQLTYSEFTPALSQQSFIKGGKVDLWYVQTPFNNPDIVAIQLYDEQGANPMKYVTNDYTHPDNARNRNLIPGGIFLVLGLAVVAAAFFLPTATRPASRPKQPPTRGYGASVLSAGTRPSAPAKDVSGKKPEQPPG